MAEPIRPFGNHHPELGPGAWVDPAATVIGRVTLGTDCSVWPAAVIRGDVNFIEVGNRTNIQDGSVLHVTHDHPGEPGGHPLRVGHDVTVGHNVTLHGCTIGNHCLIGMGSVVLDGAVVQDEVVLGAGSLVPPGKVLESGWLYLGSPVRQVRALTDEERRHLEYSAEHYVRLMSAYRDA